MTRVFLSVFTAMSLIVLGDTAGKFLTEADAAPAFVAWTRFGLAAFLLLPFCGLTRADLPYLIDWRLWLRAFVICAAVTSILNGLKLEPIANVFGAFFIGPLVAFCLSAVFLKEQVTFVRALLLLVGLGGVLLVVKPGFGASIGLVFGLLAGTLYGGYLTLTRWLAPQVRPRLLLFSHLAIGGLILAAPGLSQPLPVLDPSTVFLIFASALCSAAGNYILVITSRSTPASVISPLIYTQLISAIIAGFVFFGDLPDLIAFVGLVLIFCSGVLSLVFVGREAKRAIQ
ncbi:MAG: DMT family transporter [Pseudomonadota bacterium]